MSDDKRASGVLAEPDTGTDRGAWDDVPDATKWLDELRGDDDLEEPIGEIQTEQMGANAMRAIVYFYDEPPPIGTKLYTAPPKQDWVSLTDADIAQTMHGNVEGSNMLPHSFARAIEAKLKEKNT
jgi:hypothetical protein